MTRLRIALAQVNSTVGDLPGNAATVAEWTRRAADAGADLVVFPEMMLTGYPVEDLALRDSFVDASMETLEATARQLGEAGLGHIAVVTGYLGRRAGGTPRVGEPVSSAQNAAALLYGGTVAVTTAKHHLPNYGVFDEYRYFVPGNRLPVVRVPVPGGDAVDVAIAICEDLWQDGGPVAVTRQAGRGAAGGPERLPVRAGQGPGPPGAVRPPGPRGGRGAGLRQPDGRPGRAGLRRGFDHRRRRGRPDHPGTSVRGGAAGRGPRSALGAAGPGQPRRLPIRPSRPATAP